MVFVDRVVVADRVAEQFPGMGAVVFKGKRGKYDQGAAHNNAKQEHTRLVVSTSAGEEGVDLPTADLTAVWGNAASDIRFIQRLGRLMRKVDEGLKFATFVVTLESGDFDSFAVGLEKATLSGVIVMKNVRLGPGGPLATNYLAAYFRVTARSSHSSTCPGGAP
jgi:superfamily II DNA or RNA helicase